LEVKVVEFLVVFVGVVLNVLSGMLVSSVISKPNIVASICELHRWVLVGEVADPAVCR